MTDKNIFDVLKKINKKFLENNFYENNNFECDLYLFQKNMYSNILFSCLNSIFK
jgi:hypothetical protein